VSLIFNSYRPSDVTHFTILVSMSGVSRELGAPRWPNAAEG
jgi:hypothetical protein